MTENFLCCNSFASLDQKPPVASSHFHSSISSISSTKEWHNHSSKVQLSPANRIFLTISSCCIMMHLLACSNNYYVSTAMGRVLFLPACAFGKIKRAFSIDHSNCQAYLQAWPMTHNLFTSSNSLSDHSISVAEKRKTPIPLLVNNSVARSSVGGWHLIRSYAAMIFCLSSSFVALFSPFFVPQYPRYLHASYKFIT